MYTVLNDISAYPAGVNISNNWPLIKMVIDITSYLSENYSLDKLRVPHNFENIPIAGSYSINDYRVMYASTSDIDRLIALESFIANRISTDDAELLEAVNGYKNGNPIDIYIGTINSTLLAGAHLLNLPALSFQTSASFTVDKLNCDFISLDSTNKIISKPVQINNIHDTAGYNAHRVLFTEIKQQIKFANSTWDATNNPCWNTAIIAEIYKEYNYPDCLLGRSLEERIVINKKVADKILISNGWEVDLNKNKLNKDRPEIWRIYVAKSSRDETYISVDLGEAEFEMQDRRGKWTKTIYFNGKDTGKDYSKYRKSKNKDGHHINIR